MPCHKRPLITIRSIFFLLLYTISTIWNFFEPVLLVCGLIACIILPVYWPVKFAFAVLWLVMFSLISKFIDVMATYRNKDKHPD
jgi:hypothetical protein